MEEDIVWTYDGKGGPYIVVLQAVASHRMHFHNWTEVLRSGSIQVHDPPYQTNLWDKGSSCSSKSFWDMDLG